MSEVICEYCGKPIDPLAVEYRDNKLLTKYHWGCKDKAAAKKDRERRKK